MWSICIYYGRSGYLTYFKHEYDIYAFYGSLCKLHVHNFLFVNLIYNKVSFAKNANSKRYIIWQNLRIVNFTQYSLIIIQEKENNELAAIVRYSEEHMKNKNVHIS